MSMPDTPINSATPAEVPGRTLTGDGAGGIENIAPTPPVVPPLAVFVVPERSRPPLDLGSIIRAVYRNPAAAIAVVAAAGLIIGILLKKALPAARVFDRR